MPVCRVGEGCSRGLRDVGRGRGCEEACECHRVVVGWWVGIDELGASIEEEFLKGREGVLTDWRTSAQTDAHKKMNGILPSMSHLGILLPIALLRNVRNIIVQSAGRKRMADREQCIHPICRLADLLKRRSRFDTREDQHKETIGTHLVILITSGVVLPHAHNKIQDRHERPDCIGVASKHEVAKSDIVVCCDMACRHTCEWRLQHENDHEP